MLHNVWCLILIVINFIHQVPWPGDNEEIFRTLSQAATSSPVYHTRQRLHAVPLIAESQAGELQISIFIVFGLTRPGIEPESTASVADALSTQPLIGKLRSCFAHQKPQLPKSYNIIFDQGNEQPEVQNLLSF